MSAPVHGCFNGTLFYDLDPPPWAGVNFYLAMDADKRTRAKATSRTKTVRMAYTLLFRLRRAERMARGQPYPILIAENPISRQVFLDMVKNSFILMP